MPRKPAGTVKWVKVDGAFRWRARFSNPDGSRSPWVDLLVQGQGNEVAARRIAADMAVARRGGAAFDEESRARASLQVREALRVVPVEHRYPLLAEIASDYLDADGNEEAER